MGLCFSSQVKANNMTSNSGSIHKYENANNSEKDPTSTSKFSATHSELSTRCSKGEILQASNLRNFTYADLKVATRNFRPENIMEISEFAYFYKGCINEQTVAASKPGSGIDVVIQSMKHESIDGHTEWLAHINFLGQLYHPNLVKLVGYCIEDKLRLLIHEFTPRGSLENHIFMRGSFFQPLSWKLRLKVALGAAKGLAFLQSPEVSIVHHNFSTSCILLDLNYNAKLSGFGLAKNEPVDEDSRLITNQVYPAREDIITGNVTPKGNVYSFGVVLLQMLSGRRAIDGNRVCNEIRLLEWAPPYLANKRKVSRVLDNRLDGQYTIDAAYKVATLVLRCISKEAKFRPTMEQVVKQLEELQEPIATSPAQTKLV